MTLDTVTTRHSLQIEGKESRSRVCFGDWDGVQIAFSFSALWFQSASALVPFWVWLILRIHMWSPFSRPYKIHAQTSGWAIVFSIQKRLEGNAKPTEWKTIESPECLFLFDSELLLWAKVENVIPKSEKHFWDKTIFDFFVLELFVWYQSIFNYMNKIHQWLT